MLPSPIHACYKCRCCVRTYSSCATFPLVLGWAVLGQTSGCSPTLSARSCCWPSQHISRCLYSIPLGLFSAVRVIETVVWNRLHLLCVGSNQRSLQPSPHAARSLPPVLLKSLQDEMGSLFYFCTVSNWFFASNVNWIKLEEHYTTPPLR